MDTARIAALLEPFVEISLVESHLEQISIYIDLLIRWNARINLTAIRNEEEIVTRHFGESFFLASHVFPEARHVLPESKDPDPVTAPRALDIGSGAGFPALPLKLWAPQIHLTLIESNHKKTAFLREVVRTLTLTNINVITERAAALAENHAPGETGVLVRPQAELVTLRAVERFETILPQAVKFLAPGGSLALLIGKAQIPILTALTTLKWHPPIPIPKSTARVLSIGVNQ